MTAIGRLVTSVTAKFGVVSQKAAVRLSTEVGQKLIDESIKLGRNLNSNEIEAVFGKTLPQRLRPKIIQSREELAKRISDGGLRQEDAVKFANSPQIFGAATTMGFKRADIFVDTSVGEQLLGVNNLISANSFYAHELEHAIEHNNKISRIFRRKIIEPLKLKFKKNKADYLKKINEDNLNFQTQLQMQLMEEKPNAVSVVENLTGGSKSKIKLFKRAMKLEIPAYTTGANVEDYGIRQLGSGIIMQKRILPIYKEAQQVLKNL